MHCATIYQESVCDVTTLKMDAVSEQLNHAPFFAERMNEWPVWRYSTFFAICTAEWSLTILGLWWRDVSLLRERGLAIAAIITFGLQFNDT